MEVNVNDIDVLATGLVNSVFPLCDEVHLYPPQPYGAWPGQYPEAVLLIMLIYKLQLRLFWQ